jgi:hypothetical protein
MNWGGTIEIAQRIAGITVQRPPGIYDRSGDVLTLEEIESADRKEPEMAAPAETGVGFYPQHVTRSSTGLLQFFWALDDGMIDQEFFENSGSM